MRLAQYSKINITIVFKIKLAFDIIDVRHVLIAIHAENVFAKIKYFFMIKNPQQTMKRRELPQLDRRHLQKNYNKHHTFMVKD